MKEDALLVMFVLLCALFAVRAAQSEDKRWLYLAGLFAGFSFGSKYSGLLSVVIVSGAPWLSKQPLSLLPNRILVRALPFALMAMPVGFFMVNPQALIDPKLTIEGFGVESNHALQGHQGVAIDAWSQHWMFHLSRSIIPGFGILPTALAFIVCGMLLRARHSTGLFLVGCALLYYLPSEFAVSKPPPNADRYILPAIPFLSILAAVGIERLPPQRLNHYGPLLLGVLALLLPLVRSAQLASEISVDTRRQMTQWLETNLAPNTKIITVGGKVYLPHIPLRFKSRTLRKALGRDDENIVERLRSSDYDYLLVSDISGERFGTNSPAKASSRAAFASIAESFPVAVRLQSKFGSYAFHNPVLTLYSLKAPTDVATTSVIESPAQGKVP